MEAWPGYTLSFLVPLYHTEYVVVCSTHHISALRLAIAAQQAFHIYTLTRAYIYLPAEQTYRRIYTYLQNRLIGVILQNNVGGYGRK